MKTTTREQDAVRLLMLLRYAGDGGGKPPASPNDAVSWICGELRLQAMDFWLRNPDYLAEELLDAAEVTGQREFAEIAHVIICDEEPDLRTFPMLRFRYGAWERLDDSIGLLRTYGLATDIRRGQQQQGRRDFFLLTPGSVAADELVVTAPELAWYAERAKIVHRVAGDAGGTALKLRQKLQGEYLTADWNVPIISIRKRVLRRLEEAR